MTATTQVREVRRGDSYLKSRLPWEAFVNPHERRMKNPQAMHQIKFSLQRYCPEDFGHSVSEELDPG
jgi:hypothetical protein